MIRMLNILFAIVHPALFHKHDVNHKKTQRKENLKEYYNHNALLIMMFSMATMNAFGMVAMAEPVETTTSQVKDNPGTGDNSILPWAIGGGAIAVAAAVAAVFLGRKK